MADVFEPLINQLSKGARAAYSAIRAFAAGDLSPTQILAQLRADNVPIRTQTGLDLIALLRERGDFSRFIRTFGPEAPIPSSLHTLAPTLFKEGARFQYLVSTNSQNPLTPGAIYVNSEVPLSENQVFESAAAAFKYPEGLGMSPSDVGSVFFAIEDTRKVPGEPL